MHREQACAAAASDACVARCSCPFDRRPFLLHEMPPLIDLLAIDYKVAPSLQPYGCVRAAERGVADSSIVNAWPAERLEWPLLMRADPAYS